MTDPAVRLIVVVGVLVAAGLIALLFNRFRHPPHPAVTVGEIGERPGVVLFTSTECSTCKRAIGRLGDEGVAYRGVWYELEPDQFNIWGVAAVPLAVVIDAESSVVAVLSGVPSVKRLRRAVEAAGIERET